jgi:competence protein ComEC
MSTPKDLPTNNRSCVLQVSTPNHRLLLVGDIEKIGEEQLLAYYGSKLNSEVLIAPHHGSKTSSTANFLQAVMPRYALFAVGEHNRFHFPALSVLHRYKELGATVFSSANSGAISFEASPHKAISWRQEVLIRRIYFPIPY